MWNLCTEIITDKHTYKLHTDYRDALTACACYQDATISDADKMDYMGWVLVDGWDTISDGDELESVWKQVAWYLDGGPSTSSSSAEKASDTGIVDWRKDWPLISAAVSRILGQPVRSITYLHWWDFLGAFREIGECTFSTVVGIRWKKRHGKKLEKWETEFERQNRDLISTSLEDEEDDAFEAFFKKARKSSSNQSSTQINTEQKGVEDGGTQSGNQGET